MKRNFFPTLVLSLALLGIPAMAQQSHTLFQGRTTVKLSSSFTGALSDLGVTPGTVFPTELEEGSVDFPITGGAVDLDTAAGNILHSGGLTLKASDTQVRLQSFIIDTTGKVPMITGLVVVNNALLGRMPLFDLSLPAGFSLPLHLQNGNKLNLSGVGVWLDPGAATALNSVFHVSAFKGGFNIGTADVRAFSMTW